MIITPQRPPDIAFQSNERRLWPEILWTPLSVAVVTLVLGLLSLATGRPFLFPSLAPATLTHVSTPHLPTAKLWNTVAGQLIAIGSSYFMVWITGASAEPSVMVSGLLTTTRLWASVAAVILSLFVQILVRAVNPATAATLLLVTLGAFAPTVRDCCTLVGGVIIMAVLGEAARRWRLGQIKVSIRG